jgi:hypothetical protein
VLRGDVECPPSFIQQLEFSKDLSNIVPIPQAVLRCDFVQLHAVELGQTCSCFKPQSLGKVICVSQKSMQLPLGSWVMYPGVCQPLYRTSYCPAGESTWMCWLTVVVVPMSPDVWLSPLLQSGPALLSTELHPWYQHPRGIKAESAVWKPQKRTAVLHQWVCGNLL